MGPRNSEVTGFFSHFVLDIRDSRSASDYPPLLKKQKDTRIYGELLCAILIRDYPLYDRMVYGNNFLYLI